MYILNIARAIEKMPVNEIRYFIFENYYKQIGFSKESSYRSMKRLKEKKRLVVACHQINKKPPNLHNSKEQYQSFMRKKNTKSVKQSEIITYQPKTFENPNIVDTKSLIKEAPKISHKLPNTENVGSNGSLYSDTKKVKNF